MFGVIVNSMANFNVERLGISYQALDSFKLIRIISGRGALPVTTGIFDGRRDLRQM